MAIWALTGRIGSDWLLQCSPSDALKKQTSSYPSYLLHQLCQCCVGSSTISAIMPAAGALLSTHRSGHSAQLSSARTVQPATSPLMGTHIAAPSATTCILLTHSNLALTDWTPVPLLLASCPATLGGSLGGRLILAF